MAVNWMLDAETQTDIVAGDQEVLHCFLRGTHRFDIASDGADEVGSLLSHGVDPRQRGRAGNGGASTTGVVEDFDGSGLVDDQRSR